MSYVSIASSSASSEVSDHLTDHDNDFSDAVEYAESTGEAVQVIADQQEPVAAITSTQVYRKLTLCPHHLYSTACHSA